ncbi:MAG: hypothetical protein A2413_12945 [Treponema sp. RIFOXYC1_FULL_61_9]|nr:MAG: hypothetical protein A2Y36_07920 [Treponema sp. GWA1_62_8]OHE68675.1 MAG: hypothetical protein A2001_05660 [Treponema sp. GWC1_61_84]OHE74139.1 MAG: hypothetical protein A2413_12945 [Treponema sp. RIFOXYC1_FULL_61_9]
MIPRELQETLVRWAGQYPAITLIGPRQSGKTTLAKSAFPDKRYVNLEDAQERVFAESDPRGFLSRFPDGAIIDEIQNAPGLLSQVQTEIDAGRGDGRFILTGSNQASLRAGISQTLAGRTAIGQLYPFTLSELEGFFPTRDVNSLLNSGFYPRIWDKALDPAEALAFYAATYIERDLRSVQAIQDIGRFQKFMMLCAGRVGQLLNMASLAADAGVSPNTVKDWISKLEEGFIVFLLQPWHENIGKRLVKAPKLYFWDVGLASWFLGNRSPVHVAAHPLRGSLFENLVIADTLKRERHRSGQRGFYFFRDNHGLEVDLMISDGPSIDLVEIKSGETAHPDLWRRLPFVRKAIDRPGNDIVVYGGDGAWETRGVHVCGWKERLTD